MIDVLWGCFMGAEIRSSTLVTPRFKQAELEKEIAMRADGKARRPRKFGKWGPSHRRG
jgi:hypothetical protein